MYTNVSFSWRKMYPVSSVDCPMGLSYIILNTLINSNNGDDYVVKFDILMRCTL